MPNIKSAKKRARQNARLRVVKGAQRSRVATSIKQVLRLVHNKKIKEAKKQFIQAQSLMDRAANKKLFHKNKIARLKSRLSRRIRLLEPSSASAKAPPPSSSEQTVKEEGAATQPESTQTAAETTP